MAAMVVLVATVVALAVPAMLALAVSAGEVVTVLPV